MALIDAPWWTFVLLLIGPDIGMLGYMVSARMGALTYNILHHKALAVLVLLPTFLIATRASWNKFLLREHEVRVNNGFHSQKPWIG